MMKLVLTPMELELIRTIWPVVTPIGELKDGLRECEFPDTGLDIVTIASEIERRIEFQESDHGDWLRAQEWRKAKPELLTKIRKETLKAVK